MTGPRGVLPNRPVIHGSGAGHRVPDVVRGPTPAEEAAAARVCAGLAADADELRLVLHRLGLDAARKEAS